MPFILVLAVNMLGDGIRDVSAPENETNSKKSSQDDANIRDSRFGVLFLVSTGMFSPKKPWQR